MDKVKFTEMQYGDKEDYELLANFEDKYIEGTAERGRQLRRCCAQVSFCTGWMIRRSVCATGSTSSRRAAGWH